MAPVYGSAGLVGAESKPGASEFGAGAAVVQRSWPGRFAGQYNALLRKNCEAPPSLSPSPPLPTPLQYPKAPELLWTPHR